MKIERLNGIIFEAMVKGGFANLINHEKEINDMNVFPVPDGDTGFNMRRTLEGGLKNATPNRHLGCYLKELSHGMLLGARGNSGVILSQLFKGMSDELERDGIVNAGELRNALIRAYKTAYAAVVRPVEGTMLTVAREGIENIRSQVRRGTTCDIVLSMYLAEMKKSVTHTPELLPELKEAGVLDSGAVGVITIMEGMARAMYGEKIEIEDKTKLSNANGTERKTETDADTPFEYGYCMEFLLQLSNAKQPADRFDNKKFIGELSEYGNSLVSVQSKTIVKVHIHTFTPETVMGIARRYGEFVSFKLDNMQVQHEEFKDKNDAFAQVAVSSDEELYERTGKADERHKSIAVVSVADGDGITEILKGCGSDMVLKGGQTMNTPSEEFVRAYNSLNADRIIVFPNNGNIVQTAVQAAEICGKQDKVTVVPTKSVLEGYYALALGSVDIEDEKERIAQMKDGAQSITTVFIAKAVRDYSSKDFSCTKGEYIGFIGKKLVSASASLSDALVSAVNKVEGIEDKGSFVILKGSDFGEADEENLDAALDEAFPDMDREFLDGGQAIYDVIVGIV